MDPKELFRQAVKQASGCIKHVHEDQLANSTPCAEWDLRQLINHMVYELLWVPDLLHGKTVSEVGGKYDGDVLGDNIQASWQAAVKEAELAIDSTDLEIVVHLSYADVPAEKYIKEMAMDMCIHGWDVAQSTNCNLLIDEQLAQAIYDFTYPIKDKLIASGDFSSTVNVPDDSNIQTKLLAISGRRAERISGSN